MIEIEKPTIVCELSEEDPCYGKFVVEPLERGYGNYVFAASNRLQYMTNKDKLDVSAQLTDRGILNRDDARKIWNLPPIPDGSGEEYIIRGEYKNAAEQIDKGGSQE